MRVRVLFSWRAGPAKPIRGPKQLWAEEAAGSEGIQQLFPTLSPTSLLCVKIPNSQSNPLLFSPFIHLPIFLSSSLLFYPNS